MQIDEMRNAPEMNDGITKTTLMLRVEQIAYEGEGILRYVLVDPDGAELPPYEAGAHIDVHLGDGRVRQYSLCGDPADTARYEVAVLKDTEGRGGSKRMHEKVRAGDFLPISAPRNHFPLADDAEHHVLLAGGIGVTPMIAMLHELERRGASYELHYCTRGQEVTAFRKTLAARQESGTVHIYYDGGDPSQGLDIACLLSAPAPGTHVYYCGPSGFMEAVKAATAEWPKEAVHFEYFSAPVESRADEAPNEAFQIKLSGTGEVFDVPADQSIVSVLRDNGYPVDTSCEDGYCGTCLTRVVEGDPEHRDVVLDDADRKQFMLICCSRSRSPMLVLDL